MKQELTTLLRDSVGSRGDWHLRMPRVSMPRPALAWLGPILVIASVAVSWPAFAGGIGEDGENVQFGLFIGAASILLMAWSFVLALRLRWLEPVFGGLDSMYRVHRWAGTAAVVAMFLHTSAEPEIENGIRGASEALADQAEGLAGNGELMLYALVAVSLIRWFPYRWWRLTHKLLGVPFLFACFHFFTTSKTYANNSPWGWWFGAFMVAGLVSYGWRVVVRDMTMRGTPYRVVSADRNGSTVELELEPRDRKLDHRIGQFAFLKLDTDGLSEPHPFTIASPPTEQNLRFHIRDLGDWTAKVNTADLVGTDAVIEGPYGVFEPFGSEGRRNVWIAGGVGITPFLAATGALEPQAEERRPILIYCVPTAGDATAIDLLRSAHDDGRIVLDVVASTEGRRFGPEVLAAAAGSDLSGCHVAACGPTGLVDAAIGAARAAGAHDVEHESFDIRGGFGPDLSRQVDAVVAAVGTDRSTGERADGETEPVG